MFVSHSREKLLNAIVYFVKNTKYANTLKLFKLLNFLDFEHYRQTGKSVTGLKYEAWRKGPVPRSLWLEVQNPPDDLTKIVDILEHRDEITNDLERREFKPRSKFDPKYFTRRELKIMEMLVLFFKELRAEQMSKFSHGHKMPWEKVYRGEDQPKSEIPYDLAFECDKIIQDMPSIERQELEYRKNALAEVEKNTN